MGRDGFPPGTAETIDEILGGRLRIVQKKRGYRFSLDALLLAHFARLGSGEAIIDLGTGSGIVALILACLHPCSRILGIEIQEPMAEMARRSAVMNRLDRRVEIRRGDLRIPESLCPPASFDAAVCNPPYRRLGSGRMNPDPEKTAARHEIAGTVAEFLAAAAYALREGGRLYTIYPAARAVELLYRMRLSRLEPKGLRLVHSRCDSGAQLVLAEGVKGGGEQLSVAPPLFIYEQKGGYSAEMISIFQALSSFPSDGGG